VVGLVRLLLLGVQAVAVRSGQRLGTFEPALDNTVVVTAHIGSAALGDALAISRSVEIPDAFETIFDRHFNAVHRYLARRAGRQRADDLASQTFVVAFERRARFRPDAPSARPWLLGIATKLLANDRRAEQRLLETYGLLSVDAGRTARASSQPEPDRDVAAALAKLDQAQRDVLLLHAWGELAYEEIADALGIPVGTVRSRLSRARAVLQIELEPTVAAAPLLRTEREVS
jgi:RNA polymerase sigma-70 factor (ECF subfamily)